MVCHVPSSFPLEKTSLLVVDGISTLFASAFPDKPEEASPLSKKKSEDAQWAASRRWAIMGEFLSKLGKLAALRGIAVLLISQTSIKIRSNYGAILRPAIPSKTWADNISTRLVVFRDFSDVSNESERQSRSRLSAVGVTKLNGNTFTQLSSVVYFLVNEVRDDALKSTSLIVNIGRHPTTSNKYAESFNNISITIFPRKAET